MRLLTAVILNKLLANGINRDRDHAPVVKLFTPDGNATWLFSELDSDGDTLFGLCDLGMGEPELGYASLAEITALRGRMRLPVERDRYFESKEPMSAHAARARAAQRIVA